MGIINFAAFLVTSLLFIMSPGLDTIFILNKSVTQGRKAGLLSTLGITTGVLVHTTFAALGLSLLLAQSAMAFNIVKYLGAAYLIYLGLVKVFSNDDLIAANELSLKEASSGKTYFSAVLTNTLNPKVAIFFLAFFPQFIEAAHLHSALPFIVLGSVYAVVGLFWYTILALFAGTFSYKIQSNPLVIKWVNKVSGGLFVLMGIKIALTKR
ncbi:LysE family translocator [Mucilaginibacter aquatilis]|uniref:LysE family translocator n=1 Tax=Mucilaginibacter aquatilis TaxID=1517760 RepID=A0A6I4IQQ0_9SPHI|nr:LysE family translocator [Mucilaginibacter aquatilis]MVN92083.1 LysE family translocator [Mucilaginibacter aquatilis]